MLNKYAKNVYSQNGEDGVIEEILTRLQIQHGHERWCVEFGAWDGKHLSNTFNLVEHHEWNALYIEGDPRKYVDLEITARSFPRIKAVIGIVGNNGESLDELLSKTGVPIQYDILSIDIDSSDLDVWVRHTTYRPTIVIIEINSGIAPGVLQWHGDVAQGNSFSSTISVAKSKGYSLVCHTGNLIFVKNEAVEIICLDQLDLEFP